MSTTLGMSTSSQSPPKPTMPTTNVNTVANSGGFAEHPKLGKGTSTASNVAKVCESPSRTTVQSKFSVAKRVEAKPFDLRRERWAGLFARRIKCVELVGKEVAPTILCEMWSDRRIQRGYYDMLSRAVERRADIVDTGTWLRLRFAAAAQTHHVSCEIGAEDVEPQWSPFGVTVTHDVSDEIKNLLRDAIRLAMSGFMLATGGPGLIGNRIRELLSLIAPVVIFGVLVCKLSTPFAFAYKLVRTMCAGFTKEFDEAFCAVKPQWGESGEADSIAKMSLAAVLAVLFGKRMAPSFWVTLVSRAPPFVAGAKGMVEWTIEFVQWLVNAVRKFLNMDTVEFFRRRSKQVDCWYSRVLAEVQQGRGDAPGQPDRVISLYDEGRALKQEFADTSSSQRIKEGLLELDKIYSSAEAAMAQIRGSRPEPVCVTLIGSPGIGKSVVVERIHEGLMQIMYPDEVKQHGGDAMRMLYAKDPGKFWEGYNSSTHKTMILDDAFKRKPAPSNEDDDYCTLMRIVNTSACPLNMAHLDSKGATYFRSPFVLLTSNLRRDQIRDLAALVLAEPGAVIRRLQVQVKVTLRDESKAMASEEDLRRDDSWLLSVDVGGTIVAEFTSVLKFVRWLADYTTRRQNVAAAIRAAKDDMRAAIEAGRDTVEPQMLAAVGAIAGAAYGATFGAIGAIRDGMRSSYLPVNDWGWLDDYMKIAARHKPLVVALGAVTGAGIAAFAGGIIDGVKALVRKLGFGGGPVASEPAAPEPAPKRKVDCVAEPQDIGGSLMNRDEYDMYVKNLYTVEIRYPGKPCDGVLRGNILFVRGRAAIMPAHYLTAWSEFGHVSPEADLVFRNAAGETFCDSAARFRDYKLGCINTKNNIGGVLEDCCMVEFNTREHKDITGRFATAACYKHGLGDAEVIRSWDGKLQWSRVDPRWHAGTLEYQSKSGVGFVVVQCLQYSGDYQAGDCGAVLHSRSSRDGRCIYGFHVAGSPINRVGYAVFVTREWLDAAYADITVPVIHRFNVSSKLIGPTTEAAEPQAGVGAPESLLVARSTLHSMSNSLFSRPGASMVPSAVTGWAFPGKAHHELPLQPSDCSFASTRAALTTYCAAPKLVNPTYADLAYTAANAVLCRHGLPGTLNDRILTIPEAIAGRNAWGRFAEPINRISSPGYPWRSMGITKDKLFDGRGALNMDSEAYVVLEAEVSALLDSCRRGEVAPPIYQASPKPESRKPGKLPRLIQGAPLHYVVAWRMLFWALMLHYYTWAPEKELGLGLNPLGPQWAQLKSYLVDFSPDLGAGDYKQFDQSHEPLISEGICDAVLRRYAISEWSAARRYFWRQSNGPTVIFGSSVFKLRKGMPSGHPATGLINGLYNCTLFTMSFAASECDMDPDDPDGSAAQIIGYRSACARFSRYVRLAVVGDDNLFSTRTPCINEMTLPALMARWGATYTMDQKDGVAASATRSIDEVTFIGRSFVSRGPELLSPLRMESIVDMGNWALKPNKLTAEWYYDVYECIMAELSQHDMVTWRRYVPLANAAWASVGHAPACMADPTEASRASWVGVARAKAVEYYTTL